MKLANFTAVDLKPIGSSGRIDLKNNSVVFLDPNDKINGVQRNGYKTLTFVIFSLLMIIKKLFLLRTVLFFRVNGKH
jgi:hypothetical protein